MTIGRLSGFSAIGLDLLYLQVSLTQHKQREIECEFVNHMNGNEVFVQSFGVGGEHNSC